MNSMTGYGRATCQVQGRGLVVEVRSLNHRFFDLKLRLPWNDAAMEALVAQSVRKRIERGALALTVTEDAGGSAPVVRVNRALARRYHEALSELAAELGLEKTVTLEVLANLRDVVTVGEPGRSGEELYEELRPAVEAALDALSAMRRREGETLARDLVTHAAALAQSVARISALGRDAPEGYRRRLEERIARILPPGALALEPQRLAQEVALFADRADVSEEIVRLGSHLGQLSALCRDPGPVGRKLDFLLQELNREINTVGSKAQNADIAQLVVEVKASLEKMREQVQNVE